MHPDMSMVNIPQWSYTGGGTPMKRWSWLVMFAFVTLAAMPAYGTPQPIKGTEGPDVRAKIESKGIEGPDVRAKIESKGIEGPDVR
jgi:hypothetical protein